MNADAISTGYSEDDPWLELGAIFTRRMPPDDQAELLGKLANSLRESREKRMQIVIEPENRLRIRETQEGVWRWEVVNKIGQQFDKGPGYVSLEEAEANEWKPRCLPCPVHQNVTMTLNLLMVPMCGVPGCDFGP